jgi:transcriptional regulator with XRE-family HTH domain
MHSSLIQRIGTAVEEARRDHLLSERELARLAGVSRSTVHRLERGGVVRADLAVRVAAAITVVDLYSEPLEPVNGPVMLPVLEPLPAELVERGWAS